MERIRVEIWSDADFDNLVAEVYVDGKYVALISNEHADHAPMVVFPGRECEEDAVLRTVELPLLLTALKMGRDKLILPDVED
jgi:hypothetical protein